MGLRSSRIARVNNQASREGGESSPAAPTRFPCPVISIFANTVVAIPGQPALGGGVWLEDGEVSASTITGNRIFAERQPGRRGRRVLRRQPLALVADTVVSNTAAVGAAADGGWSISRARFSTAGAVNSSLTLATTCCRTRLRPPGFYARPRTSRSGRWPITAARRRRWQSRLQPAYDANPATNPEASCPGRSARRVVAPARCDQLRHRRLQISAPTTYVANPAAGSVTAYATGATGDAAAGAQPSADRIPDSASRPAS